MEAGEEPKTQRLQRRPGGGGQLGASGIFPPHKGSRYLPTGDKEAFEFFLLPPKPVFYFHPVLLLPRADTARPGPALAEAAACSPGIGRARGPQARLQAAPGARPASPHQGPWAGPAQDSPEDRTAHTWGRWWSRAPRPLRRDGARAPVNRGCPGGRREWAGLPEAVPGSFEIEMLKQGKTVWAPFL